MTHNINIEANSSILFCIYCPFDFIVIYIYINYFNFLTTTIEIQRNLLIKPFDMSMFAGAEFPQFSLTIDINNLCYR